MITRLALLAAVLASLLGWALIERAMRQFAESEADHARKDADACRADLSNIGVRRDAEDRAAREHDPTGVLRERYTRPD